MSPGNSKLKRGQISLFALVLITIFLQLAMAHWKLITLYIKGHQTLVTTGIKDEIMMNALPQIRRQGTAGSSYIEMNDERLDYELRHQNTDHLDCELVVARVKNRDQWPTLAGQWITAGSQRFYILDYWREE